MPDASSKVRRSFARSCEFCRTRKVRCDGQKPTCKTCVDHQRPCHYQISLPRPRPTKATINGLRAENKELLAVIQRMQDGNNAISDGLRSKNPQTESSTGETQLAMLTPVSSTKEPFINTERGFNRVDAVEFVQLTPDRPSFDAASYLSIDEAGNLNSFGPSSAWQMTGETPKATVTSGTTNTKNTLIANAALMRQQEYRLAGLGRLDGVPINLAIHLLDIHWNRQHHSFLLTYRPVIIKGLLEGGDFGSKFLLNCIFASASKFSTRSEAWQTGNTSQGVGSNFFQRCDELINEGSLLLHPTLPTTVGLLLLGSTYVSKGVTTKGWLFTGYALRMVYDLGLHIECKVPMEDAIEEELRKRVFWGAFVCDKLQSLYLGRPFAIKLRDAHVSLELNDMLEENEIWEPYVDPTCPAKTDGNLPNPRSPTYSVSCFQRLCLLSKIITRIIDEFYVVGATALSAQSSLRSIDDLLCQWERNLPEGLQITAIDEDLSSSRPPNVLCLHVIYNALIVLLHRPLVSDGHLRSTSLPAASWKRCSEAAEKITRIVSSYRRSYSLRGAPYLVSYGLYVACTIHVRNIGLNSNEIANDHRSLLECSVCWLEELAVPNPAVQKSVSIVRDLITSRGLQLRPKPELAALSSQDQPPNLTERMGIEGNTNLAPTAKATMTSWEDPNFYVSEWDESFSSDLLYGLLDQHFVDSTDVSF